MEFDARAFIGACLLAAALCAAGCRTPMPPGAASDGFRLGPFFETARSDGGGSMVALRPFFSRETAPTNAPGRRGETDVAWPLAIHSRRGDHYYWRALLLYGTGVDGDPDSPEDPRRLRLFPFYFSGRTLQGEEYAAVFPLGGTIHNFLAFGEVRFVLFPIYASGETAGVKMRTVLWPFYLSRHGENVDQLRVWPFYGRSERRGLHVTRRSRFIAWPLWTESESFGQVSGSGFVLFPLFGHSRYERERRGAEESWSALGPLFCYAHGDDGYRKVNAPWPFVRLLDADDRHERHFWPLCGRSARKGFSREYLLWPLVSRAEAESGGFRRVFLHAPLPFYFHRERIAVDDARSRSVYSRLWPLFSYRASPDGGAFVRFPELSLWSGSQQVERNWAPLWSLYTYRRRADGAYCNDLLWGLLSWGRNAEGGRLFSLLWIPFSR